MIPPLKAEDDPAKAIVWMEEFHSKHLPVVDHGRLLGFLSEDIILEANSLEKQIKDFTLVGKNCYVQLQSHFFDILRVASDNKLEMVAVVSDNQTYEGVITVEDTLLSFAQSVAIQAPGSILVLSMNFVDYSLAEVSRLIEENHGKVLSCMVKDDPESPGKIRVTLKIDQLDLSRIIATLERFGYKILARYQETKSIGTEKERIDMLLRFLDV